MPLIFPTDDLPAVEAGTLYVVATPSGNRGDITLRALSVLGQADILAAEDTRTSGRLLATYGIRRNLVAYHEHNERRQAARLLEKLQAGRSVALISDAGTPLVSDPGYRLVKAAIDALIPVVPIPGPSSVLAALCASGLPTDAFAFIGFAARKKSRRQIQLEKIADDDRTLVFFESPQRLLEMLKHLAAVLGNRQVVVARELTKLHEEFIRGPVKQVISELEQRPTIRGEVTLLVAGNDRQAGKGPVDESAITQALKEALDQTAGSVSRAAAQVAADLGLNRRQVYRLAVKLKKMPGRSSKDH